MTIITYDQSLQCEPSLVSGNLFSENSSAVIREVLCRGKGWLPGRETVRCPTSAVWKFRGGLKKMRDLDTDLIAICLPSEGSLVQVTKV